MHKYILFLSFLFVSPTLIAQLDYQLSDFKITHDAPIKGTNSSTKGLDIQFTYRPKRYIDTSYLFSAEIKSKEHKIAEQEQVFHYAYSDSIAYLVDSLGIDSVGNLDTIFHLYIPYRSIAIEEGNHKTTLTISVKGKALPVYNRPFQLNQVKIYDLFLDLKNAVVIPDPNAKPLSLNYHAPDPKWLVHLGANRKLHGITNRNAFKAKAKTFSEVISNYDSIKVCVYNADPTAKEDLGCILIDHGNVNFTKSYQQQKMGDRIKEATFEIKKLERKPVSTNFVVTEEVEHKGIKGIKIDFNYGLPLQYKRRTIDIEIKNEEHTAINNIFTLKSNRIQEENRIIGTYSYFISYYNLQNSSRVKLVLTGNDKIIAQYESPNLAIQKTIKNSNVQQQVGYIHNGLSGILYQIDFTIPTLPKEGLLKLNFPTLSTETIDKVLYWTAENLDKTYKGSQSVLPLINQQVVFIFLPYFVAPKHIHLTPTLTIEAVDIPPIQLVAFESESYACACPSSLNDIQIQLTSHEEQIFEGLSGQLFTFNTTVPDYYHSKGYFELQLLENGQRLEKGFFINKNADNTVKFPIHNQQIITVFIPYRFMKEAAKYEVILQAKSELFALSEARKETFNNLEFPIQKVGIYLQQVSTKDWKNIVYKIGIRNNKNPNSTYEHLGYQTILKDQVANNYKPDIPNAVDFIAALDDELIIWIKEQHQSDDEALRFKTSIRALQAEKGFLTIKNQGSLKKVVFKIIDRG